MMPVGRFTMMGIPFQPRVETPPTHTATPTIIPMPITHLHTRSTFPFMTPVGRGPTVVVSIPRSIHTHHGGSIHTHHGGAGHAAVHTHHGGAGHAAIHTHHGGAGHAAVHTHHGGAGHAAVHTHHTHHTRGWKSTGLIIIDTHYFNRVTRDMCQTVLLYFNKHTGGWELPYGKESRIDTCPADTARRETVEETNNMFHFKADVCSDSTKVTFNNKDIAYVVRVVGPGGGLQTKFFEENARVLHANHAPGDFREMSDITRVSIDDLICADLLSLSSSKPPNFSVTDVYGKHITITGFHARFIRDAINANLHSSAPIHKLRLVESWDDSRASNTRPFLNGTKSYIC